MIFALFLHTQQRSNTITDFFLKVSIIKFFHKAVIQVKTLKGTTLLLQMLFQNNEEPT